MISVKIIAHTVACGDDSNFIEKVNSSAANLCYNEIGAKDIMRNMTKENAARLTRLMVNSGHTSTIEHVSFTFAIEGISRSCTHQLVRHRIASYSQQSQRYVKGKMFRQDVIKPKSIKENPRANTLYEYLMDEIDSAYKELLNLGIPAEDARFILPNATETKIVVTMNARSLLHFFEERCCVRSQWEIRTLANLMLEECRRYAPVLFEKAGASCKANGICKEGKRGCKNGK